jgi:protein-S-isoprenylcysteine O-methyltransferase Ste14
MTLIDHVIYAALWASFGIGHSLLTGASRGTGLGRTFGRGHRLAYNVGALLHLALVYGIGRVVLAHEDVDWPVQHPVSVAMLVAAGVGVAIILLAVRRYDRAAFLGTAQLRGAEGDDDAPLNVAGLNRFVRHPLYLGVLMVLWSGATSPFGAATALWGTTYILLGSRAEERRLVARFGTAYSDYRHRVPGLLPWRRARW